LGSGTTFTASGSITAGAPVALNNDGTVSQVTQVTYTTTPGNPVIFNCAVTMNYFSSSCYIGNSQVLVAYSDRNYVGCLILGTVSGSSVIWGKPVVFNSLGIKSVSLIWTGSQFVVTYVDSGNSSYGTSIVGSVSGTTLILGSPVVFNSNTTGFTASCWDSADSKIIVAYTNSSNFGYSSVGTISGTGASSTISFGTPVSFYSSSAINNGVAICWDSSDSKVVIAYSGSGNYGFAIVGSVSGTNLSFGSAAYFYSTNTANLFSICYTTGSKVVVASCSYSAGQTIVVVGTVSGTSISFGSINAPTNGVISLGLAWDSTDSRVIFSYLPTGSTYGYTVVIFISGTSISVGGASQYNGNAASSGVVSLCWDSTDSKLITVYNYDSSAFIGYSIIGTYSSDSITYGTGTAILSSGVSSYFSSCFDSADGKVIIAYKDAGNNNYGTVIVGTVSGTSISFGNPVVFNSAVTNYITSCYTTGSTIAIAYQNMGNSQYGTAVIGTVSGTSISFGTPVVFNSANTIWTSMVWDAADSKIILAYQNASNTYGYSKVGTVSGNSISFGAPNSFSSNHYSDNISVIWDSINSKVVITYQDSTNSGIIVIGTVSGTSISFGTPVTFTPNSVVYIASCYDSTDGKVIIAYSDSNNGSYGTIIVGTVSGTSITLGTAVIFNSAVTHYISIAYDSYDNQVCICYQNAGNSNYGTAVIGSVSGTGSSATVTLTDSLLVAGNTVVTYTSVCYDSTDKQFVLSYNDTTNARGATTVAPNLSVYGLPVRFNNTSSNATPNVCYLGNSKIAVTFGNSTTSGQVVIGTVSGSSITFGTPVTFYSSRVLFTSICYATNNTIVIACNAYSNNYGYAVVGTVSGNTITLGSPVNFGASVAIYAVNVNYDPVNNKVALFYTLQSDGSVKGVVGTVSGTTISFGTAAGSGQTSVGSISVCYHSGVGKFVLSYPVIGNPQYGILTVASISGTTMTLTGSTSFSLSSDLQTYDQVSVCYDPIDNFIIVIYGDDSSNMYGYYMIVTLSGTTLTLGTPQLFNSNYTSSISVVYNSVDRKVVVSYMDNVNNYGNVKYGTVSGSGITATISFTNSFTVVSYAGKIYPCYDPDDDKLVYVFNNPTTYGNAIVIGSVTSNVSNLLGLSTQTVSNGASVPVTLFDGVNTNQSGLTTGAIYYVSNAGTISTTTSNYLLGKAVSATSLLVKCGF